MYGKTGIVGATLGTGTLATTGFGVGWYVLAASMLLVGGLLLLRLGRRRAASR